MDLIIAEDHPLFRDALTRMLKSLVPAATVHAVESFDQLLPLLERLPDCPCLLMDLQMPGGDAFAMIPHLRQTRPDLDILIVTASESEEEKRLALMLGASCFLSKSLDSNRLETALMNELARVPGIELKPVSSNAETEPLPIEKLTPRQAEVYELLCQGDTNKMIARKLDLTEGTVKLHVRAILQTLGVSNRTQAVALKQVMLKPE